MAGRATELAAEKETAALKKLQAAAGFVDKAHAERLDWMYEQSALSVAKQDEDRLMNRPVAEAKDQDLEDVKRLQESAAGSLFLRSATKTTEDMLRKLREDPLFHIRRQEQAARENMMANPLVVAKLRRKAEKQAKKEQKKAKKKEKKAKKAMKKQAKAQGKLAKKKKGKGSSSSSSSSSDDSTASAPAAARADPARGGRSRSPPHGRGGGVAMGRSGRGGDDEVLGPGSHMVDKRAEYAAKVAAQRDAALASRGAARRMSDEERAKRLEQMRADADRHERSKDMRIAAAEQHDREMEEKEKEMRARSDQKYFREMRTKAYMGEEGSSVADRLKNQRHRRAKNLNDPLERDG